MKKLVSLTLVLAMIFAIAIPSFATDKKPQLNVIKKQKTMMDILLS